MPGIPEYLESNQQNVAALHVTNFASVGPLIYGYNPKRNMVFRVLNSGDVWVARGYFTDSSINAAGNVFADGVMLISDKNAKENFSSVNTLEILGKLASIPIQSGNYKEDPSSVRHIGPTAQDFQATFGLNGDDTHISSLDLQGVALAAIQGLNEKLKAENDELHAKLARLEERLFALESKG
ncbi:tail fiber domain-containing protein [Bacillus paramycoides]|uniref:tail fiber domain-containing protein n=1 Tax=Bacillus paramycoides TaxID=2026194 RepID=UPI002E1FD56D|nr:tail fiber domain-containing protein [Bacillus paramycoides]